MTRWGKGAYRSPWWPKYNPWIESHAMMKRGIKLNTSSEENCESNDPKLTPKEYFRLFFIVREKHMEQERGSNHKVWSRGTRADGFLWVPKSHTPNWSSLLKVIGKRRFPIRGNLLKLSFGHPMHAIAHALTNTCVHMHAHTGILFMPTHSHNNYFKVF